jgi:signal transduction histidine kinase
MMPWDRRHGRPPWWPANEPWPPARSPYAWRHGRARFVRRIAFVFAALLFFSAFGVASLISRVSGGALGGASSPFAVAAVAGLVVFALLFTVVRRVGIPLGGIVEAANRMADGDFSTRVAEHGPQSLRTVARAFNTMAARLESHDQQRRHLMADIAHELRTPLSVIQGRLEGFLDGVYPRDDARMEALLDETRLLARLVEDLRTLANAESGALTLHKEPTDVAVLVQDVVDAFGAEATQARVAVQLAVPNDLPLVAVDPLRIREILSNLMSNALRHTPAGGAISIAVRGSSGRLLIAVADTGAGIAPEDLPKIFDRFYKGTGSRGSGLGLTIARSLAAAHGGEISAESTVGHGTTITLTLPIVSA